MRQEHQDLKVKCQKMEGLIQKILREENDHPDGMPQLEEEGCSDQSYSSNIDGIQHDKKASEDHIIDLFLGIIFLLDLLCFFNSETCFALDTYQDPMCIWWLVFW